MFRFFFSIYIILLNDRLGPKISLMKCLGGYKGYDGLFSKCVDKCATLFTYPYWQFLSYFCTN